METVSISHASGATLVFSGPGDNWQPQTPYSFHSLGFHSVHQCQAQWSAPAAFATDAMTDVTGVDPWRGRHCCMLTHSQEAALLQHLRTRPSPAHSPALAPGLELQPLCMCTLQSSALWLLCPCHKSWRSSQPVHERLCLGHQNVGSAARARTPQPGASPTEGHGDYAATPSPVLGAPHPTQPVPSHPLVDKDCSLLKPIHKVGRDNCSSKCVNKRASLHETRKKSREMVTPKEQNNFLVTVYKEMEMEDLLDKEFKIIILRKLRKLREKEQIEKKWNKVRKINKQVQQRDQNSPKKWMSKENIWNLLGIIQWNTLWESIK